MVFLYLIGCMYDTYCITTKQQEFTYQPSYDRQLSYLLVKSLWLLICTACLPVVYGSSLDQPNIHLYISGVQLQQQYSHKVNKLRVIDFFNC